MRCPLCGSKATYIGTEFLECDGIMCQNNPEGSRKNDRVHQDYSDKPIRFYSISGLVPPSPGARSPLDVPRPCWSCGVEIPRDHRALCAYCAIHYKNTKNCLGCGKDWNESFMCPTCWVRACRHVATHPDVIAYGQVMYPYKKL